MHQKTVMKNLSPLVLSFALVAVPFTMTGCAVLAVGALIGGVAFVEGELVGQINGTMYQAVDATKATVAKLRLTSVRESGDETSARMVAYDPQGNKIVIRLTPESPRLTIVRIRVGTFGDEAYSRRILSEMQRQLR